MSYKFPGPLNTSRESRWGVAKSHANLKNVLLHVTFAKENKCVDVTNKNYPSHMSLTIVTPMSSVEVCFVFCFFIVFKSGFTNSA